MLKDWLTINASHWARNKKDPLDSTFFILRLPMPKKIHQTSKDSIESPIKAYENIDFLHSKKARLIRILCELIEPKDRFKQENVDHTIVLFGSARTPDPRDAERELKHLQASLASETNPSPDTLEKVREAERQMKASKYYRAAYDLSKKLTEWSLELPESDRLHICSGGGPGIMEAANRGASDAGGKSIGLGISLPFEQRVNPYISKELAFEFKYFFIRKYWFVLLAKSLVAFPGGFGTMDELFETLTLMQTGKVKGKTPIVLFGSDFWRSAIDLNTLVEWGMISKTDLDYIHITDSVEDAFDFLVRSISNLSKDWVPLRKIRLIDIV